MSDKKTILIIEDDYYISELYKAIIEKSGYTVIVAQDGNEGIEKSKAKPDMILLDIMLPFVNGLDVLKKIKENPDLKNIPVVLFSNLGQESIVKKAYDLGAQGYLLKVHVKPQDLTKIVKTFLDDPKHKMEFNKLRLD